MTIPIPYNMGRNYYKLEVNRVVMISLAENPPSFFIGAIWAHFAKEIKGDITSNHEL